MTACCSYVKYGQPLDRRQCILSPIEISLASSLLPFTRCQCIRSSIKGGAGQIADQTLDVEDASATNSIKASIHSALCCVDLTDTRNVSALWDSV